jgi:hypothetical protein
MTFTAVYPERTARQYPRWVAIYRTPKGNFTHVTLTLRVADAERAEAETYAREQGGAQ